MTVKERVRLTVRQQVECADPDLIREMCRCMPRLMGPPTDFNVARIYFGLPKATIQMTWWKDIPTGDLICDYERAGATG